ncbi:hypothetical protein GLOIN_2v1765053 [Rhizophagus clarus]|uniref:Uncharacterized protein n=1 Tax=Rhizophagus clarus TaxID=94130 RepID=A0A8H3LV32_9GLOM|nr:hypothetical protein GLOIN_2v1765053 [Rhizophagus clarus]
MAIYFRIHATFVTIVSMPAQIKFNRWDNPSPVPPVEKLNLELEEESKIENVYDTTDEGDTISEEDFDNESRPEDPKKIFRRIEDPTLKRLVENRKISDQGLCAGHLAFISENYPHRLATFEDIEDQINDVYKRELSRLGGIKTKIVLIAHMYLFVQQGRFRIYQDIAFPSEILDITRQNRIDKMVSR